MSSPAPCRMIVRSKDGIEVYTVNNKRSEAATSKSSAERPFLLKGVSTLQHYSPDGTMLYVHQPSRGVCMCRLDTANATEAPKVPFLQNSQGVQMLTSSPKGTYLLTWERLSSADPTSPNLKVWNAKTGHYLYGFIQKNLRREAWPYVQWTFDEQFAFLLQPNEIRVYEGHSFLKNNKEEVRYIDKLKCSGLVTMSLPETSEPRSTYLVATFVPKTKDKPARASLHVYPTSSNNTANPASYPALLSKSLFQADEVNVEWSPKGDAALMALQTSVDTSGESYYGSTTLFLLHETSKDVITVPLQQQGPVLDVSWMPNPSKPTCFVVIAGKMPSMASLHHGTTGDAMFLFGHAHRNTISWSDHGRFLLIAGFGNLAGGMTFWDRNKQKVIPQYDAASGMPIPIPQITASCTVGYGWSPDSRLFGVSTTSPRMNVDNGIRVYQYNGQEVAKDCLPWDNSNYQPDRLLQASFVPAAMGVYEDRPQSPAPKLTGEAMATKQAPTAAAVAPPPAAAGRYVPPKARGRPSSGMSLAERMRKEKEGSMMGATKVTMQNKQKMGLATTSGKLPVGMAPEATADQKSKSAQRREKQKLNKQKKEQEEASKAQEEAQKAAVAAADPEKRARKLRKQLKQIQELKEKNDLNDDQRKKIESEAELQAQLDKLGL